MYVSPHLSELVFSTPQPQKPDDSPTGPGSLVWNRRPCTPWAVALNASSRNRTAGMTTPQEAEASTGGQLSYRPPCSNDLACPDKPRRTQGRKPALSNGRRRNTLCSRLETGQHNSTASYTPGTSHTGIQCHAGVPVETAPSRFRGTIPAWDQRRRNQLAAVLARTCTTLLTALVQSESPRMVLPIACYRSRLDPYLRYQTFGVLQTAAQTNRVSAWTLRMRPCFVSNGG